MNLASTNYETDCCLTEKRKKKHCKTVSVLHVNIYNIGCLLYLVKYVFITLGLDRY